MMKEFLPETYKIPKGITENLLIQMLLNHAEISNKKLLRKFW